jgi:general secretion pathway protein F
MAVFAYRATTAAAQPVTGTLVADTPRQAREQLHDRGLVVRSVVQRHARANAASAFRARWSRRRLATRSVGLTRDLATLLAVGVPLVDALGTLAEQATGPLRSVVLQLQDRVASGASVAVAMAEQPGAFDELDVALAGVGEAAGNLDVVLDRLAEFKEARSAVRNRVGTALIYPAIVFVVAVSVSILLMTFVVPKLLAPLVESGQPIPPITRIVKGASDAIVGYWWAGAISAVTVGAAAASILNTPRGRAAWDRFVLRVPLLGDAAAKQSIARVAMVLAVLLRSGIVFVRAVEIAARTAPNGRLREALVRLGAAVTTGADVAEAVRSSGAFPPMVVQMFAVGQQSGRLEDMLDRLAADYDRQVRTLTTRLTAVLEPALILLLVAMVGTIALATLLPMLEAADAF